MRKYSRREKRILKLLGLVVLIAIILEADARFREAKSDLELDIQNQQGQLDTYLEKLSTDSSPDNYREKTEAIEKELENYRDRVLELPRESDATLLIKETIDDRARELGMTISSISSRKSKPLVKDQPLLELKTYFAFDSDLESMLEFFHSISNQGYFMVIDTINLGTRRRISRRGRRSSRANERPPLNGNAVLHTLFLPNAEGSFELYLNNTKSANTKPSGETSGEGTTQPPPDDEDLDQMDEPEEGGSIAEALEMGESKTTSDKVPPITDSAKAEADKFADPDSEREMARKEKETKKKTLQNRGLRPPPRPLTSTARPKKQKSKF